MFSRVTLSASTSIALANWFAPSNTTALRSTPRIVIPGLSSGTTMPPGYSPGADEDHVAGLRGRDRLLDRRVVVGHADQPALALGGDRPGSGQQQRPDDERGEAGWERAARHLLSYAAHAQFIPAGRAVGGLERATRLGEMDPIVPAEHPEHQVEALRPTLPVQADSPAVRFTGRPPEVDVRGPQRLELREELQRVVVVGVQPVDPQVLVVADELRPVVREDPPVPARHDHLGVRDVGEAQERGPLARLGPHAQAGPRPRR